jgi:hypothetical protein
MFSFGKRKIAYLAVFIMVMGGTGAYFSLATTSGSPPMIPINPYNSLPLPGPTVDSFGSGTGGHQKTYIGNTSWCAAGETNQTTFDVGEANTFCWYGVYNETAYSNYNVSFLIFLPGATSGTVLGSAYVFGFSGVSNQPEIASYTFGQAGTYQWRIDAANGTGGPGGADSACIPITVNPAPTISTPTTTTQNPLEALLPVSISFSAAESGGTSPLSYQWGINGTGVSGATSSAFTHVFSGYASYSITVNVTDAAGYKITSEALVMVIYPPLKISLTVSPNPGDIDENIVLTATASGGSGSYSSYIFSINGAGHTETTDSYTTTFSSSGSYPMNVSVTDSAGYTAYSLNTTELISTQLAAVISSNVSETEIGFGVEFTSSVSGGNPPYTYSWSVSDNGSTPITGTGSDINYTDPAEAGTLSAKLTVKDSQTGVYTAYKNITVLPDLKLVNYSLSNSVRWVVSENVTVYGNITGGLGPYSVYVEIGATTANGVMHSNIAGSSFSYTFSPTGVEVAGSANLLLVIYDSLSYSQSSPVKGGLGYSGECYLSPEPAIVPYVKITASPQRGIAPLTVDFTGFIETSTSGAVNSAYNWTFSNGVNTLTQNPIETFSAGNYTATLTADSLGEVNSASLTIVSLPLPATFSYSPHTGGTVLTVYNFTAKTAWWVTSYNITWTFPNGNQEYGNFTHYQFKTYSPTQNVSAVISYTNGSYTSYLNVKMTPAPITADFSLPTFIPVQTLISVNATVNDPDSNQITYVWNFNGQNYTGASQLFYLGNPQVYNITLTATDQYGMTYTITKNVTAVIPSNDGNITISVITKTNGPYTTYDLQIYSKDGISVVEALLGTQTLSPTFLNDTDGYWYQLTLNQGSYYAGTYSLEFIVFDKAAQSNSKTVSFFVSQTYGKSSGGFSLTSFFGNTETEIIAIISIVSTIGGAIIYSRDKKDRDTQYFNIDGAVVKAKRTPGSFKQFEKKTRNKGKGGS